MRAFYASAWESIRLLALPASRADPAVLEPLGRGAHVLDLGSGRGPLDDALRQRFAHVVSLDLPESLLDRPAPSGSGGRFDVVGADLEQGLPFRGATFDAALGLEVLEHLADPAELLASLARVLKPQGTLLLTTVNARHWRYLSAWALGRVPRTVDDSGLLAGMPAPHHGHVSLFTGAELVRWLEASGFEIERHDGFATTGGTLARRLLGWARREFLSLGIRVVAKRNAAPAPERRASKVSVVVVSHDAGDDLDRCLSSLRDLRGGPSVDEVLVIDNASTDGGVERCHEAFPEISVLRNGTNVGFGAAVNRGLDRARHPRVLILNPDVTLARGALVALEAVFRSDPLAAVVGGRLLRPDGGDALSWAHFPGARVWIAWFAARRGWTRVARRFAPREGDSGGGPVGACLLVDRQAMREIGGFDPGFFLYAEELDLFERLRRHGRTVHAAAYVVGTHREGGSTRRAPERARRAWLASHRRLLRVHRRWWARAWFEALVSIDQAIAGVRGAGA